MSIFKQRNLMVALGAAFTLSALLPASGEAQEIQSLEQMRALVRQNMPEFLKNPGEIVAQLLNVPLAPPLSRTFDQAQAIKTVFGEGSVGLATDCRRRATAVGNADPGDCTASNGREAGKGAFTQLSFSKNMGNGNIKFLKRLPVDDAMTPNKLPTAKLSNQEALNTALKFLDDAFGMPMTEIPLPPADSRATPVRNLTLVGGESTGRKTAPIVVQKMITLQRGFQLEKPYTDSATGMVLSHVRGPGLATVAVDDSGVVGAMVDGWQELRKDPRMTANSAKPVDELINEIAEDLFNDGVREFDRINFEIQVGADWRGTFGVLLPAVQVAVVPVPHDLGEAEQAKLAFRSTAGEIKTYSLVERSTEVDPR